MSIVDDAVKIAAAGLDFKKSGDRFRGGYVRRRAEFLHAQSATLTASKLAAQIKAEMAVVLGYIAGKKALINDTDTAATTHLNLKSEAGLIKAQVAVPSNDLVPNANLLGATCAPAEFQASACPANSVVGSAIASSPLLSLPLSGSVALVSNGSPIPDIGLDLNGQLHLLLTGSLTLNEVVTFDGLPDIPISAFQLTFTPSPGLLMANRDLCAPPAPVFHADFTGYNGATSSVDSAATVDGCGAGNGGTAAKCKKHKKKHKKKHRAAESKKHKKKHCKKKRKHKKHRK